MLILIAESKTMTACNSIITHDEYEAHRPLMDAEASWLMKTWDEMSPDQLAAAIKISMPMARSMKQMIYEFPNKTLGARAIEAYTGVVFKALDYPSLPAEEAQRLNNRVRIVSSLYGWLSPWDIIKRYRLDFTTPLAPGGASMAPFWRKKVTEALLETIASMQCHEILDLMPADASKCFDWKEVKAVAKVWKVDFKETGANGTERTPHANKLKTLRGQLLREIITDNIPDAATLASLAGVTPVASPGSDNGTITFRI